VLLRKPSPGANAPSIQQLAHRQLNRNAVSFSASQRADAGSVYPVFYSFVPHPYRSPLASDSGNPAKLSTNLFTGEGPDGFSIAAARVVGGSLQPGRLEIPIRLGRDLVFDLLEVRYSVRGESYSDMVGQAVSLVGKYYYPIGSNLYNATDNNVQDGFPRYNSHPYKTGIPVYEFCRASLYVRSGQQRSIYGGNQTIRRGGLKTMNEEPVNLTALQGLDDGKCVMRSPYLCARESVVMVKMENWSDAILIVNGYLFGYEVAMP
jgi:hypothetical protein